MRKAVFSAWTIIFFAVWMTVGGYQSQAFAIWLVGVAVQFAVGIRFIREKIHRSKPEAVVVSKQPASLAPRQLRPPGQWVDGHYLPKGCATAIIGRVTAW